MRLSPLSGIMDVADSLEKTQGGKRRNVYVRTGEHDIGPSFHGGTCQGGSGCTRRDDDPRLCQPRQTATRPTARPRRRKMGGRPIRRRLFQPQGANRGQVAGGDKVVTRFIVHFTHDRGELMGVAPTGRELSWMAIVIHRIVEGKIAEEWGGSLGLSELLRRQRLEQEISERARIEQELQVARRIQQASLPKEVPELEGWQITPYYQPAREVGGDFYDFHLLPEDRLGLVVGDATGKGVPAALVMSTTCGMLQAVSEASDSSASSPGEVLKRVKEVLTVRIPTNMFVT